MKNAKNGKQFGFMMACFLTSAIFLTASTMTGSFSPMAYASVT